jgi:hypothetical protein
METWYAEHNCLLVMQSTFGIVLQPHNYLRLNDHHRVNNDWKEASAEWISVVQRLPHKHKVARYGNLTLHPNGRFRNYITT